MPELKFIKNPDVNSKQQFQYTVSIGRLALSEELSENAIKDLRDQINNLLGLSEISKHFDITIEEAENIKKVWRDRTIKNKRCYNCDLYNIECHFCVNLCQSPLEQDMYLEMKRRKMDPVLQIRVYKDGHTEDYTQELDLSTVLTIPDFYIESGNKKIAIYADGHTYHERTEYQALRDRSIDREMQTLGYMVLRFTGKEIRDDVGKVVESIKAKL